MEGFSEYEENNTKPSKKEIMEDVSELETEYRMLHTKHTIDEINKMSKFFHYCVLFQIFKVKRSQQIAIIKNIPTKTAVKPVLPPASTPAELST